MRFPVNYSRIYSTTNIRDRQRYCLKSDQDKDLDIHKIIVNTPSYGKQNGRIKWREIASKREYKCEMEIDK